MKQSSLLISILILLPILTFPCTDIVVGKKASKDGSVIVSHTGAAPECRVHVVPGMNYEKGEMAAVYYGLQDVEKPLYEYGEIIGYIPQIQETYTYFHSGYSHMNEFQLAIAESTMSQRAELKVSRETGKQIMTIEQAMVFALQRCKTAKEALELITELLETYGFLPSCGPESEALCIADTKEAWVLEVFSVGKNWDPESDEPGAIWAAQRVPDDHVVMIPNWSIIKEIDLSKPNEFKASENYMQVAIDSGWYNPKSGKPFIWQDVYSPIPREWATSRFWLFYKTFAEDPERIPDRESKNPYSGIYDYVQFVEPLSIYPFSFKPKERIDVRDVIDFQRSVFEGTIYDMTRDPDWYIPDGEGGAELSPMATPFPTKPMRDLLDINYRRMVVRGGYGMVIQLRDWLPDAIGGVYWFYVDNQYVSTYVPIYCGTQEISEYYKTYDPREYSDQSARWAVDFVDNLLYLRWQDAAIDMKAKRDSLENFWFANQPKIEAEAKKLYKKNPEEAKIFLTKYTIEAMESSMEMFQELQKELITKYTNNKQ